jgi:hypothetical protein
MKKQVKEKFNFNKRVIPKIKYHPFYIDLDGKRPPPKSIIWYLNVSILLSISVWFMSDSIVNYQIVDNFITFVETELAPKITGLKELVSQGYIAPKVVFHTAVISFWIAITFLPLVYIEARFMSKKVLLSDYKYYRERVFNAPPSGNPKRKYTINKEIVLAIIFFAPLFVSGAFYMVVDDPNSKHFYFMSKSPLIAFYYFGIILVNFLVATLVVNIKSRIILMRYNKTKGDK